MPGNKPIGQRKKPHPEAIPESPPPQDEAHRSSTPLGDSDALRTAFLETLYLGPEVAVGPTATSVLRCRICDSNDRLRNSDRPVGIVSTFFTVYTLGREPSKTVSGRSLEIEEGRASLVSALRLDSSRTRQPHTACPSAWKRSGRLHPTTRR